MLDKYRRFKPFTESEAWWLFRLAAFGEAIGWTILISGIILTHFIHNRIPVLLCGQFHGILFMFYLTITVAVSPSLSWRSHKVVGAIAASVPPYGTLAFEIWQAHQLKRQKINLTLHRLHLAQLAA